jgi:hypothetical protein
MVLLRYRSLLPRSPTGVWRRHAGPTCRSHMCLNVHHSQVTDKPTPRAVSSRAAWVLGSPPTPGTHLSVSTGVCASLYSTVCTISLTVPPPHVRSAHTIRWPLAHCDCRATVATSSHGLARALATNVVAPATVAPPLSARIRIHHKQPRWPRHTPPLETTQLPHSYSPPTTDQYPIGATYPCLVVGGVVRTRFSANRALRSVEFLTGLLPPQWSHCTSWNGPLRY